LRDPAGAHGAGAAAGRAAGHVRPGLRRRAGRVRGAAPVGRRHQRALHAAQAGRWALRPIAAGHQPGPGSMSVLRRRPRPPYKLLSLLLQYPSDELLAARPSLREEVEALPSSPEREALRRFFDGFGTRPGLELQQGYVETFDLRKGCGLYLSHYT